MRSYLDNTNKILQEAKTMLNKATTNHDLEVIKSDYLGKKGKITQLLQQLIVLDKSKRPQAGQIINEAKEELIRAIDKRKQELNKVAIEENLNQQAFDITLPPRGQNLGSNHPITKVGRLIEDFFANMGFVVVEGPEVEDEFHNFTALNIPPHHPARTARDTFYFHHENKNLMLRTQTSPIQIRAMQTMSLPLRIICPGKVFRRDSDATHSPMFHQVEMLMVDENLNFANLKWLVIKFINFFFKGKVEYRFRPSYFPFVEPGGEVDIKWKTGDSWSWLELGGLGVVHPNVLRAVNIDPKRYHGLAFGFGIDRLTMLYYGIQDIRMFFENDLEFLEQF